MRKGINIKQSALINHLSLVVHPEHEGNKVGQTILMKQLMTGVFNSRPPIPRYTETWDVDLVLKYIMNLPEDKDLTLKQLTHKVTLLMSFTSASRSSEICKLDTKFMNVEQEQIVFTITELTKTRKGSDKPHYK